MRPKTNSSSDHTTSDTVELPVRGNAPIGSATDVNEGAPPVGDDASTVVPVPVRPATAVVVVAPGSVVEVEVVDEVLLVEVDVVVEELVVVDDDWLAVQVMPAGVSPAEVVITNWTFQYLSSWVAEADPTVQAIPTL
jgi:hypothetical protein